MKNTFSFIVNLFQSPKAIDVKETYVRGLNKGEWGLPSFQGVSSEDKKVIQYMNRYLEHMRLQLKKNEYTDTRAKLVDIITCRSNAFLLMNIYKACPTWVWKYKISGIERIFKSAKTILWRKQSTLNVSRFYIPKPNGKYRPIGSPDIVSKVILNCIESILRVFLEGNIGSYQHGFRRNKSIATATWSVIEKMQCLWEDGKEVVVTEFDLESFFNNVNVFKVCDEIDENFIAGLGTWIKNITWNTIPDMSHIKGLIKSWKRENEVVPLEDGLPSNASPNWYHRQGFTQGSPLSPLLCIFAIELTRIRLIRNLVMYADDGLIVSHKPHTLKVFDYPETLEMGIKLARDKKVGVTTNFRFLGSDYNMKERKVIIMGSEFDLESVSKETIMKAFYKPTGYAEVELLWDLWQWRVMPESFLAKLSGIPVWWNRFWNIFFRIIWEDLLKNFVNENYKDHKWVVKIYHFWQKWNCRMAIPGFASCSTKATVELLNTFRKGKSGRCKVKLKEYWGDPSVELKSDVIMLDGEVNSLSSYMDSLDKEQGTTELSDFEQLLSEIDDLGNLNVTPKFLGYRPKGRKEGKGSYNYLEFEVLPEDLRRSQPGRTVVYIRDPKASKRLVYTWQPRAPK